VKRLHRRTGRRLARRWLLAAVVLSACNARDPSRGPGHDPQLCHDLVHALVHDRVLFDEGCPQLDCAIVPGHMTVDALRSRAREVPGWDLIAVVGPYNHGANLLQDPLLVNQSESVSEVIAGTEGWENDGIYDLILVRQGAVVGGLWLRLEGDLPGSFVVARE
jgi:hypothetical protein